MTGEERICSVHDVPDGEARRFDLGTLRVCLVRLGGDWYAIGDECSHQDVSLAGGEVFPGDREIECWKHGGTFSPLDGEPASLPATRPVPVYDVRIDGEDVYVVAR